MVPLKITFTRLMVGAIAALVIGGTKAHDPDHTDQNEWYQSLMQPDVPTSSCCGEAKYRSESKVVAHTLWPVI